MKLTITALDTTGIQSYIFGSNRLRENVGASYLVSQVTENWAIETLGQLGVADPENSIDHPEQNAELIYAGGGNTVLLFKSRELAISFTRILSKRILEKAPGINLVVAHHHDFEWDQDLLHDAVQTLMAKELDVQKRSRIPSAPLLGLGVTQDCNSTRLVAVDRSSNHGAKTDYPVSREVVAKLDVVKPDQNDVENNIANLHLKQILFDFNVPNQWKIPLDFDDFGRSRGETSYIAVVHIDGNSMGDRFKECGKGKSDREYINAIRALSSSVKDAGKVTLRKLTNELIAAMPALDKILDLESRILPFRPIVYGGDDVTFVCDGRLGLTLAARYLQILEEQVIADEKKLSSCAGVCIVKVHYPFARAYEISEELCRSAKKVAKFERITKEKRNESYSAIDWHIASSGLLGSITEIRQREYQFKQGNSTQHLSMRPLLMQQDSRDWQTWENFIHVVKTFEKPQWKNKRNKIMALRDVLRRGADATKEFLTAYRLSRLPNLPASMQSQGETLTKQGWLNNVCGYFDAIEALDFYIGFEAECEPDTQNIPIPASQAGGIN